MFDSATASYGRPEEVHMNETMCRRRYLPLHLELDQHGCVEKDTEVLMADGTRRRICEIRIGDLIQCDGGSFVRVLDVIRGEESGLWRIKAFDATEILATDFHPFLTTKGPKAVIDLSLTDELIMEGDRRSSLQSKGFDDSRRFEVYNLIVEGNVPFFANGYLIGDNAMQGDVMRERNRQQEVDIAPELVAEAKRMMEDIGF